MGILAMNIVSFAMPPAAYLNPLAYGLESGLDMASFAFNFLLLDGRMRGLFSFLFGASLLLVIKRTPAERAMAVTYRRLLWLLLFGCIHFYLIWYGDILIGYALVGMVAFAFRNLPTERLVGWGAALLLVQLLIFLAMTLGTYATAAELAGPDASPAARATWESISRDVGVPSPERLQETLQLYRGDWWTLAEHQLRDKTAYPFIMSFVFGWETLAYMLFGMAALKSGFLSGEWDRSAYLRTAGLCLAVGGAAYLVLLGLLLQADFSVPAIFAWSFTATVPFRPIMVVGYAALIILATAGGGGFVDRLAAAGRMAFTNYLGTSILMTALFYGWGLGMFGQMARAELWLPVLGTWVLILLWSKPWLERFRYGPLEWLWRSLARGRIEPLRRLASA
jgi:uncharacterized protein